MKPSKKAVLLSQVMKLAHSIKAQFATFGLALKAAWAKIKKPNLLTTAGYYYTVPAFKGTIAEIAEKAVRVIVLDDGYDVDKLYIFPDMSGLVITNDDNFRQVINLLTDAEIALWAKSVDMDARYTLEGNTYAYKDMIKAAGGAWASLTKRWVLDAHEMTQEIWSLTLNGVKIKRI